MLSGHAVLLFGCRGKREKKEGNTKDSKMYNRHSYPPYEYAAKVTSYC